MGDELHDEHHWEGGGDTAKHLEDVWVAAVRDPLHQVNLIQKESPFFATAATLPGKNVDPIATQITCTPTVISACLVKQWHTRYTLVLVCLR